MIRVADTAAFDLHIGRFVLNVEGAYHETPDAIAHELVELVAAVKRNGQTVDVVHALDLLTQDIPVYPLILVTLRLRFRELVDLIFGQSRKSILLKIL